MTETVNETVVVETDIIGEAKVSRPKMSPEERKLQAAKSSKTSRTKKKEAGFVAFQRFIPAAAKAEADVLIKELIAKHSA